MRVCSSFFLLPSGKARRLLPSGPALALVAFVFFPTLQLPTPPPYSLVIRCDGTVRLAAILAVFRLYRHASAPPAGLAPPAESPLHSLRYTPPTFVSPACSGSLLFQLSVDFLDVICFRRREAFVLLSLVSPWITFAFCSACFCFASVVVSASFSSCCFRCLCCLINLTVRQPRP